MAVSVNVAFEEARKIEFDVIVVPGSKIKIIEAMIEEKHPLIEFLAEYSHPPGDSIMLSICTGALLAAAAGALKGLRVTTHHLAFDALRQLEPTVDVTSTYSVRGTRRFIDGGRNANGIRIVTIGGK